MKYPTLDQLSVAGKVVFVRSDLNVTYDDDGAIIDDTRIQKAIPTLQELIRQKAKVIVASHLGRPKGQKNKNYSLFPVAERLASLLSESPTNPIEVIFPDDCVGMEVQKLVKEMREGQVMLLENLRFHAGEEGNDENFAEQLASFADVYVNDAFGTLHREHASTAGMTKHFEQKAMGRLVEQEVQFLGKLLFEPRKPFTVVLGGAKVSDKLAVIENLLNVADNVIVGGGMAYTFLKAQGFEVGRSLVEDLMLGSAKRILQRAETKGIKILLPVDHIVADEFKADAAYKTLRSDEDWGDGLGVDVGPLSVALFDEVIQKSETIFWNGPLGVYEMESFRKGTLAVAASLSRAPGLTVVGGGDSLGAVNQSGYSQNMTHLSTGGGASLKFLEGAALPGLKALL